MNCKPGDLAVIVRTQPMTRACLDQIVQLTTRHSNSNSPCWNYVGMPLRGKCPDRPGTWSWYELPDEWLRPIVPPAGTVQNPEVIKLYASNPPETADA